MENLKPGTKYSVYVKAKTAKGYGTASDPVELDIPSKCMLNVAFFLCEHVGTVVQLVEHWPSVSMPCVPTSST